MREVRRCSTRVNARLGELRESISGSKLPPLRSRMAGVRPETMADSSLLPRRSAVKFAGLLRADIVCEGSFFKSQSAMQRSVMLLHIESALRRTLRSTTVTLLAFDAEDPCAPWVPAMAARTRASFAVVSSARYTLGLSKVLHFARAECKLGCRLAAGIPPTAAS